MQSFNGLRLVVFNDGSAAWSVLQNVQCSMIAYYSVFNDPGGKNYQKFMDRVQFRGTMQYFFVT